MSQVTTKFVADNAIIGTKIRLANNQPLRARNFANSADISILQINTSDNILMGALVDMNAFRFTNGYVEPVQLASDPTGVLGQIYYNNSSNMLRFYNGTAWADLSSGSGANTALSNLTTTAINQDLIFDTGVAAFLKSKDDATAATQALTVQSGNATGFQSGSVTVSSGTSDTTQSGGVILSSGNGAADDVASGSVNILSGTATGVGPSGAIAINSGNVASGASGSINIITGDTDLTQNAGNIVLQVGNGGSPQAGLIQFNTGNPSAIGQVWTASDTNNSGYWASPASAPSNEKQLFTLSGTDITNQYIDLDHVALTDSIDFLVQGGGIQIEGASYDYSVNYTGGAGGFSRITFLNGLATGGASALVSGDVVVVKFQHA